MINGFEKETHELTNYEHTLVQIVVKGLLPRIGKSNSITNKEICKKINDRADMLIKGKKVAPERLRKIIHYIRCNRLVTNLIATSSGYYRAESKADLDKYRESLIQRINSIAEIEKSFGNDKNN